MAWYRHVTLALLAYAFLVALRAAQPTAAPELVAVSVPELRRLLHIWASAEQERQRRLRWSQWRRQHQAVAQRGHQRRRQQRREPVFPPSQTAGRLVGIGSLTEAAWQQIAPLLPVRRSPVGRPRVAPRPLLEGIVWVMQTGVSWRAVPTAFGPWQTVHMRYQQWVKAGIWEQVVPLLDPALPDLAAA